MHASRPAHRHPVSVSDEFRRIVDARHHDPFAVLGRHVEAGVDLVRAFIPHARRVFLAELSAPLERIAGTDLFEWRGAQETAPPRYRLSWEDDFGRTHTAYDPYCFPPQIGDLDLYLFGEGRHWHAYRFLGAHPRTVDGVDGVLFATWAPSAERVSVVGDFNRWDGRRHPMRVRGASGVWELFIPGLYQGALYKFEIRNRDSGAVCVKADPYGRQFERRPATAAIVSNDGEFDWGDAEWLAKRASRGWLHRPMSVYELHPGSWRRPQDREFYSYRELAHGVVDHLRPLGFTHIELLPVTEHPLDQSWGYQTTGYYAPTSRYGNPDDFRYFVDRCHRNGIGVLLDWPPAHFPKDGFALARFDGSALYEHEDPRRGEHREWGTLIFNYGRNEVRNFLLSSALFWLEEFHIDGLRVDAVASMLYLDYSRTHGDWLPNIYGGRENLEAMAFLRELNAVVHEAHPGAVTVAEESTSWPMVSRPVYLGGLGFSMKWNMGWMHDTLKYMGKDPIHRHYHHDNLTFGLLYAFTENFVLPLSHDEVVHLKRSLLDKMPGDVWQRFANLRALYVYMFTYPGKKLLFMGAEFGQWREWQDTGTLEWYLLDYPSHRGVQSLVADLNRLYRALPALHRYDFEPRGFEWIDCHDSAQSVITYLRRAGDDFVLVALNLTPVPRFGYRIGVPSPGHYRELLNSDSSYYWGSNLGNGGGVVAEDRPWMGRPYSISVTLPPLAGLVFALS